MVTRGNFDLFVNEEPYQSLVMLINLDNQEFIVRLPGLSRDGKTRVHKKVVLNVVLKSSLN